MPSTPPGLARQPETQPAQIHQLTDDDIASLQKSDVSTDLSLSAGSNHAAIEPNLAPRSGNGSLSTVQLMISNTYAQVSYTMMRIKREIQQQLHNSNLVIEPQSEQVGTIKNIGADQQISLKVAQDDSNVPMDILSTIQRNQDQIMADVLKLNDKMVQHQQSMVRQFNTVEHRVTSFENKFTTASENTMFKVHHNITALENEYITNTEEISNLREDRLV